MAPFRSSIEFGYRSGASVFTDHDFLKGLADKSPDATPKEDPVEQSWFQLSKISDYCRFFFRTLIWVPGSTLLLIKRSYIFFARNYKTKRC